MKESKATKKICDSLKDAGAMVFAIVGGELQTAGIPDRYIHHSWWSGWIEFKMAEGKLSKLQRHTIKEMNKRRPNSAFVVRCFDTPHGVAGDILYIDGDADSNAADTFVGRFDGSGIHLLTVLASFCGVD